MASAVTLRLLGRGDEAALEHFLRRTPHTTMFLRGNLRESGIVHTGEPYTADYVAAFESGEIIAVAAHSWGGNLLVEAPRALEEVTRGTVSLSGRPLHGILGCSDQVQATRDVLGLGGAAVTLDSCEDLFSLDLSQLVVPAELRAEGTFCRPPHAGELELLAQWRAEYSIEALGEEDSDGLRGRSREDVERYQQEGRHWVLAEGGRPVAYSAFNARLPDCVQVGGVYTPPPLRRGRRGRSVVAGSLLLARQTGVQRSVLFTDPGNHPAQRAYRALGYERVGHYAILLFENPEEPR